MYSVLFDIEIRQKYEEAKQKEKRFDREYEKKY
jgi:hypothetical protein